MTTKLDLINPADRLTAMERVTAEGLLSLSKETVRGNEYFVFGEAPKNLREYYELGLAHGDWEHIIYQDERINYPETFARACQLGNTLQEKFGVSKGDKVSFSMRNYPEWMYCYMAVTSIGAVVVPLNSWWQGDELEYGITNSESKVFIADQERLERLGDKCSDVAKISVRSENPDHQEIDFYQVISDANSELNNPVELLPEDDASIMYTSGSTGYPKGVVATHRSIIFAPCYWMTLNLMGKEAAEEKSEDVSNAHQHATLVSVPLFHVTGCHAIFLLSIPVGRKTVLMYKWDPDVALDLIEREKVTLFTGVPTMSYEMVEAQKKNPRDISTLTDLNGGGAARPPEQVKEMKENMKDVSPGLGYGLTETNALAANNHGDVYVQKPLSTGFAIPKLIDLKIVDDDGNTLNVNEDGEVCIRGACTFRCYWKNQEATDEVLDSEGWFRSGDIGCLDEDGFLYIKDRKKEIVSRGGENIACLEVEAAITEHPAVLEASVFGVPDERLGEKLATMVACREDQELNEAELSSFLAKKLAKFKIPEYMWFQTEQLPRIASGKIAKKQMREEAIEKLGG